MKRSYRYRFYPTPEQEKLLQRTIGCVRFVYNKALEARIEQWRRDRTNLTYSDTSALLTQWKRDPDFAFLMEVSSVPLQQSLRHQHSGFCRFWQKKGRHPKFRSKRRSSRRAEYTASAFTLRDGELKLAKMKTPLRIKWSRPLPEGANPSTVTVTQDQSERWHVSILVDTNPTPIEQADATAVGVDLGLDALAALSTGERVDNPRHELKERRKLARAQAALCRKEKGSANREKARLKVARIHSKIADRRRDHLHKLSTRLIHENQVIVIESLAVENLKQSGGRAKRGLNRSISNAGWARFRSMLEYKAKWYGRTVIPVDRFFPSSQLCSSCGARSGPSNLDTRVWNCPCGAVHDRDVNAARNILAAGLAVTVCGEVRRHNSVPT